MKEERVFKQIEELDAEVRKIEIPEEKDEYQRYMVEVGLFESWFNEYDRELDRGEGREIWESDFNTFIETIEVEE